MDNSLWFNLRKQTCKIIHTKDLVLHEYQLTIIDSLFTMFVIFYDDFLCSTAL